MGDVSYINHDSRRKRAEVVMREALNLENKLISDALGDFTLRELFIIRESLLNYNGSFFRDATPSLDGLSNENHENLIKISFICKKLNNLIRKLVDDEG